MTAIGIAFMGALVALEGWLDSKFRIDANEGECVADFGRRFQYGAFHTWNGDYIGTYVYLRLSSYTWDLNACRDEYGWMERVLIRDPHTGEWRIELIPEYPR